MADQEPIESPFANFVPSAEPPTLGGKPKTNKPKGDKKPAKKKSAADPAKPAAAVAKVAAAISRPTYAPAKKPRKPRAAKASRIYKIGIGAAIIALAGLTADDIEVLKASAAALVDVPKKQRQRVVAALAKIFA